MSPYYFLKHAHYYFRIKIPVDLLEYFGRIEIQRTLHTTNPKYATSLATKKYTEFERLFHLIRLASTDEDKHLLVQQSFARRKSNKQVLHKSKRLSQIISDYTSEYKHRWRGKTAQEYEYQFKVILQIMGDIPLAELVGHANDSITIRSGVQN